ncbi:hypothetical protein MLD38_038451 [Melastoma candidum]|uniref:Uncharacterized protein n=1 Tax=Melastoma candidum TaxID=119954 RepID=A0ACB9KZN5_9MYRT|nr:hypothetical protein MLD38_038451 [Melastoma candidum]
MCGPEANGRVSSQGNGKGNVLNFIPWLRFTFRAISQRFLSCMLQLAAVAALCVQYEAEFRPNMSIVVKALQPLLRSTSSLLDHGGVQPNPETI